MPALKLFAVGRVQATLIASTLSFVTSSTMIAGLVVGTADAPGARLLVLQAALVRVDVMAAHEQIPAN